MNSGESERTSLKKVGMVSRRAIGASRELVRMDDLHLGSSLPLVIRPAVKGVDLLAWATNNRHLIEAELLVRGGVLFRNFDIESVEVFEQFIKAVSGDPLEYRERSSPRSQVSGNIYTSTDHPPAQSIFLHNEHSYSYTFPLRIFFFCMISAQRGGETPIADTRKVFERINPKFRERFIQKKWMYIRNFGEGFGLPWPTVFQSSDKTKVEQYCLRNGIEFEWRDGDSLRTRQVRPAIARHPQTGEITWFNHATFFHVSTLDAVLRDGLLAAFEEEDLPNNTFYGDGSSIEPEVLDNLREAYLQEKILFEWQRGDILMLDNMLVAHGREPFVGPRRVTVGMAHPYTRDDIS